MPLICRSEVLGWGLKLVLCLCVLPVLLLLWPEFAALGSTIGGAIYGFLSPIMATFDAAREDKPDKVFHCMYVCISNSSSIIFTVFLRVFSVTFGYNLISHV